MIRFPNPGSDIEQMLRIFKIIYAHLSKSKYFTLDNMAKVMTAENVASSSGYIGSVALEKSYERIDKTRNPIYNQAKMYAEVYRFMGWIASLPDQALNFNFTFLGVQVANTGAGIKDLFEQCLLGITYPNEILDVKFSERNKPFVSILLFAENLDGRICRDEIILTAMVTKDFYSINEFEEKIKYIQELRNSEENRILEKEKLKLEEKIGIRPFTMENYTRFVISSLVFTGWFEKKKVKEYGKNNTFLVLTNKGKELVKRLKKIAIINTEGLIKQSIEEQANISKISLLQMLKRANLMVDNELEELEKFCDQEFLFSPYQYFDSEKQKLLLPEFTIESDDSNENTELFTVKTGNSFKSDSPTINKISFISADSIQENQTVNLLKKVYEEEKNVAISVNKIGERIRDYKQNEFYPLVAEIFQIIFDSSARAPQAGVNNERFDVIIPDDCYSIPVEVKSPTEEEKLSVKAVRQALENKIVLQSRYSDIYRTTFGLVSLAVGYRIPEERSDVYMLIEDIYEIFNINVGIVDIYELLHAAYNVILNNKVYELSELENRRGVIKFENL